MTTNTSSKRSPSSCVGAILVEKFAPEWVTPGENFEYELAVTNTSDRTVESIVLVESLLSVFQIEASVPSIHGDDPHMGRWVLGPLPPRRKQRIFVRCSTRKAQRFRSHTSFSCSIES